MSPVETLLAEVLAAHQWRDVQGNYEVAPYIKHFGCSCGWLQDVAGMSGFRSWQGVHIAHVAAEQAKALRALLDDSGIDRQMQGCLSGFDCAHDDSDACADALAAALADLVGGAR